MDDSVYTKEPFFYSFRSPWMAFAMQSLFMLPGLLIVIYKMFLSKIKPITVDYIRFAHWFCCLFVNSFFFAGIYSPFVISVPRPATTPMVVHERIIDSWLIPYSIAVSANLVSVYLSF
jgi:hypothetical protein